VGPVILTIEPSPRLSVAGAESVKLEPDIVVPAAGVLNVQSAVVLDHTRVDPEYTLLTCKEPTLMLSAKFRTLILSYDYV
tara:strand:- start:2800 stop:3039 length:240 start_codon:yes stop_codon:yes gene_type:complete